MNPFWIKNNFNFYSKKNVGDCAIRAIVAATGLDYRVVCKMLNARFVKGKGLLRDTGIDLEQIKKVFSGYFDNIVDFYTDSQFVPDEMKGSKEDLEMQAFDLQSGIGLESGDTLNEFCFEYANMGIFLVSLVGNPKATNENAKRGGHIVCAKLNANAKRQGFIDTWNSGEMIVDAYMRVVKHEPIDSPNHWKYDYEKKCFV